MPNFKRQSQCLSRKGHSVELTSSLQSDYIVACRLLQAALNEFMFAQSTLDGKCCVYSSSCEVNALLRRIRAARQKCGELAEYLLQICPTTFIETNAQCNVINEYLSLIDVDQMPSYCKYGSTSRDREKVCFEAAWLETISQQRLAVNVLPWKGRPRKDLSSKGR